MRSSDHVCGGVAALVMAVALSAGLPASAAQAASAKAPKKEAEKVHICLAPSKAQVPNGVDAVSAVRETFSGFLTGPSLSVEPLSARLESQVREEAKQNNCRYILFSTVKHAHKTTGLFGRIAAGAVQNGAAEIAAYSRTSGGRVMASAASAGAANVAVASQVRQRDQLTLEYRLEDSEGHTLSENTEQRVAHADGEDVLTPLIQNASEAIAHALKVD